MSECSVCYELTNTNLSCNHLCCVACIKKIMKLNSLCPMCRNKFDVTPFKYVRPTHTPNLKLSVKLTKFFNRYLSNRYFLTPCKRQRLYSHLLYKNTDQIVFENRHIHICSMLLGIETYDILFLLECLLWLHDKNNKTYSYSIRQQAIYAIKSELCGRLI